MTEIIDKATRAISEIRTASYLISCLNGSFVRRIVSRFLALRVHNLVGGDNLLYQANNAVNQDAPIVRKSVRGDLNALKALYNDFFEQQRHKFSGHFQHLPLSERIDLWSNIDFTTANFFSEMPITIFGRIADQLPAPPLTTCGVLPAETIAAIRAVCEMHANSKTGKIASDIFSLTRPNTGGIVHGTLLQNQCGALNALELIIDFELDLLAVLPIGHRAYSIVKELLVADVISYIDNIFTRQDINESDPQHHLGLDRILPDGHDAPKEILNSFKSRFRLHLFLNKVRPIRDKVCCHIDSILTITEIQSLLDLVDSHYLVKQYQMLKHLIDKVYRSDIILSPFIVKNESIDDEIYITGIDPKPYSKEEKLEKILPRVQPDYENLLVLNSHVQRLADSAQDTETYKFFSNGMNCSQILEKRQEPIRIGPGTTRYEQYEHRSIHEYLTNSLSSDDTPVPLKLAILRMLLKIGRSSNIRRVLLDSYLANSMNLELASKYCYIWGELVYDEDSDIIKILAENSNSEDFFLRYNAVLALFKIDISSRRRFSGIGIREEDSGVTLTIIRCIEATVDPLHRLGTVSGLLSEAANNLKISHHIKDITNIWRNRLVDTLLRSVDSLMSVLGIDQISEELRNEIKELAEQYYMIACLGAIAEYIVSKKVPQAAEQIYNLVITHVVKINWRHNWSVYNYAVMLNKAGEKPQSVEVLEKLIEINPDSLEFHYAYLTYLKEVNEEKFASKKSELLANYELSAKDVQTIQAI